MNLLVCALRWVAARTRARRRTPTRAILDKTLVIGDVSPENVHDAMMEYRAVFSRDANGHETRADVAESYLSIIPPVHFCMYLISEGWRAPRMSRRTSRHHLFPQLMYGVPLFIPIHSASAPAHY